MRIRSIMPDFYRSEDVAAMDWHTRLVFIGLWSYVDDNGVGRDVARLVASDLFPLDGDPTETLRRVSTALEWLSQRGQIQRYKVDGVAYLFVVQWDRYQRVQNPGKERYPRPTSDNVDPTETLPRVSVDPPETLSPGEGEKGRRGEELQPSPADAVEDEPDPFDEFWAHYPRKVEKQDARKAWRAALKKTTASELIDAVKAYPFGDDPKFVKHAATWLNKGCWADDPTTVRPGLALVGPNGHREWTLQQLTDLLGPAPSIPQPPYGLDERQLWEWEQQARAKIRADRIAQAERKTGTA